MAIGDTAQERFRQLGETAAENIQALEAANAAIDVLLGLDDSQIRAELLSLIAEKIELDNPTMLKSHQQVSKTLRFSQELIGRAGQSEEFGLRSYNAALLALGAEAVTLAQASQTTMPPPRHSSPE